MSRLFQVFASLGLIALGLATFAWAQQVNSPPSAGPATLVTGVGVGTTGAVTGTLAGTAGKFTYICGFSVNPGSAATAITIPITITGLTNTFTWVATAPVTAVGVSGAIVTQNFSPCIPASAANTAIVVTSGALGTSGINNDVQAWGYQL